MSDPQSAEVPIIYNDSKLQQQGMSALAAITLIIAAIPTLSQFWSARDLVGFVQYLKSEPAAPLLSSIVLVATFAWRQVSIRRQTAKGTVIAKTSPIAVLKSEVAADPSLARPRETETAAPAPATRLVSIADIMRGQGAHGQDASGIPASEIATGADGRHEWSDGPSVAKLLADMPPEHRDGDPDVAGFTECKLPPSGWYCTQAGGHDGPCAPIKVPTGDLK